MLRKSTSRSKKKKASKAKKSSKTKKAAAPKLSTKRTAVDMELVEEVNIFMKEQDLVEFQWEAQGVSLKLRRREAPGAAMLAPTNGAALVPAPTAPAAPAAAPEKAKEEKPSTPAVDTKTISSPFVGTFYKSPSPNQKPFVEVGQIVKPGDSLCIVEAMKLMNEIESDLKGRIVKVLVEDGTPVEYGESLFEIEPL